MSFLICAWLACGSFVLWGIFRYKHERGELDYWELALLTYFLAGNTVSNVVQTFLDCALSSLAVLFFWPAMVIAFFSVESVDEYWERRECGEART